MSITLNSVRERTLDVQESVKRVEETFHGNYEPFPIYEDRNRIGRITSNEEKIFVTFRGSIDSLWEIFTCLDIRSSSFAPFGLKGRVHRGIYTAFTKVHEAILNQLKSLPSNKEIIVEGYSRGAGIATLLGLYLKKTLPQREISVFTYSPIRIFDPVAIQNMAQTQLLIYNFVCQEDLVTRWPLACLGYCPCPDQIVFSSHDLPEYKKRVENRTYSYLIGGLIGRIIRWILPAYFWEAHMLPTYIEGAPISLKRRNIIKSAL